MGRRFSSFERSKLRRQGNSFPISWYSIFLLTFGLLFWVSHLFIALQAHTSCHFAIGWLGGWFDYASPFQWFGLTIVLLVVLWIVRLIASQSAFNFPEWAAQGVFLFGICAAFLALKVHIFPNGTPNAQQFDRVAELIFPLDKYQILPEEKLNTDDPWKFDYPPPPKVTWQEHPRWSDEFKIELGDVFKDRGSPFWYEYQAMKTCVSEYEEAIKSYETEQALLRAYWKEFDVWYALNRWRYEK